MFEWHQPLKTIFDMWELIGPLHQYGGTCWATVYYDEDFMGMCGVNIAETWYKFDAYLDGQLLQDIKAMVEDGYKDLIKDNPSC